jgi:hypothetical protein
MREKLKKADDKKKLELAEEERKLNRGLKFAV